MKHLDQHTFLFTVGHERNFGSKDRGKTDPMLHSCPSVFCIYDTSQPLSAMITFGPGGPSRVPATNQLQPATFRPSASHHSLDPHHRPTSCPTLHTLETKTGCGLPTSRLRQLRLSPGSWLPSTWSATGKNDPRSDSEIRYSISTKRKK